VAAPSSLVDVAPTLLDVLGVAPLAGAQGVSLAAVLRGGAPPPERPLYFGWIGRRGARGVRYGDWKLTQGQEGTLLFDLAADPGERAPVADVPAVRQTVERLLMSYVRDARRRRAEASASPAGAAGAPVISEDVERSLRALGYVE